MKRNGAWIWLTDQYIHEKQSVFFRREFVYEKKGSVILHLSAESHYKLYVNGSYLANGPMKGDRYRKYYDTIDISNWLREEKNVIAVHVLKFPDDYLAAMDFKCGPVSLVNGSRGGFWMESELEELNTDSCWKCFKDISYGFREAEESKYAGDMEICDGSRYEAGWTMPGFDDSHWSYAVTVCPADQDRLGGVLYEWQLYPRTLPMLKELPLFPVNISKCQNNLDFSPLLAGMPVEVPPFTDTYFDLDMGELVNAYVRLALRSEGDDARISLIYSEAYWTADGKGGFFKGVRDNNTEGELLGETDCYLTAPGEQTYEPFWFRVFRYLRIRIVTGAAKIAIMPPMFRLTGYPVKKQGTFQAEDPVLNQMWDVSVRTLERCMLDTYVDCPYYEQMQYIMDTMIESLLTFQITDDDRLVRRAIEDFHSSRRPDGMIQCNAPAAFVQIIPSFSIYYIDMLYYHYQYYGDKKILQRYLATVLGILQYFDDRVEAETGLLGATGYWSFVDWVDEWRPNHGSPVCGEAEPMYLYNQMYAYGLLRAVQLFEALDQPEAGRLYREKYDRLRECINRLTIDAATGYYRISAAEKKPSQHAQLWAVLSGCVEGSEAKELMLRCMSDKNLLQCSYSMSFYLFRAMEKAGIYDAVVDKWKPWKRMLDQHVTTWPEDTVSQRSECHAWSAIPLYDFIAVVLGIRPEKPGYEEIRIKPSSPELGDMQATIATVKGPVWIRRMVQEQEEGFLIRLEVELPADIPVHIYLSESEYVSFCQRRIMFDYKFKGGIM